MCHNNNVYFHMTLDMADFYAFPKGTKAKRTQTTSAGIIYIYTYISCAHCVSRMQPYIPMQK